MTRYRHAPPKASMMFEALRGLGYSTAAALADLIDNSITAQATTVHLEFLWAGTASAIRILDDGNGMDAEELDRAMRLGAINPLDARADHDLGRFGLGLKTASLSQCRRLTVSSRKNGPIHCLRWDLDVIASAPDDGWHLLEDAARESAGYLHPLESQPHGTLVLWEKLDRVVTPGFGEQDFLDLIDRVEQHLAMVFHRYLEGLHPRLRILINEQAMTPWNPFLTDHPATWSSPVQRYRSGGNFVEVQGYVLPHRDRLDADVHEQAGGPGGWIAQQGFYVYRNQRLLVAGGWLGLGSGRSWTRDAAHQLARIRIDLPNSLDADWNIDIRKSTARPPVDLRKRLLRLAEDVRQRARQVYAHRRPADRAITPGQPVASAWQVEKSSTGMRYRISEDHPVVRAVLDAAGPLLLPEIRAMLRVIEETVPVQRLWVDAPGNHDATRIGFADEAPAEVAAILKVLFRNLVQKKGCSPELARAQLLCTEPFDQYPELVLNLPDTVISESLQDHSQMIWISPRPGGGKF
jgi:hypothetical protein